MTLRFLIAIYLIAVGKAKLHAKHYGEVDRHSYKRRISGHQDILLHKPGDDNDMGVCN